MTDSTPHDPKALWQGQEQETDPMTLEQIHALVGKYDDRARRTFIAMVLAVGFAAFLVGTTWVQARDAGVRIAIGLYLAGSALSLILLVKALYPRRDPAESAGAHLRRQLERRLRHLRGGWALYCAPLVPSIVAIFLDGFLRNDGPLWKPWAPILAMAILATALVAVLVVSSIRARGIKADLDELDRLMAR